MKRDIWSELADRVRKSAPATIEIPFQFEERVLRDLNRALPEALNPLLAWFPLLRPALGLAFAVTLFCLLVDYKQPVQPSVDFVTETESLIQMAVLNE